MAEDPDELFMRMRHEACISILNPEELHSYTLPDFRTVMRDFDHAINLVSGGEFDLNSFMSAGLFGLGLLQVRNRKILPAGLALILQANSYFRDQK